MNIWILIVAAVTVLVTLSSISRNQHWLIRIGDFPRLQIIKVLIGSLLLSGFFNTPVGIVDRLFTLGLITCLVYQISWVLPHTFLFPKEAPDAGRLIRPALSVMVFNILMKNRNAEAVLECAERTDADVVLFLEPDEWWAERLERLNSRYPHMVAQPLGNCFGMIMFSRLELVKADLQFLVQDDIPSIRARFRTADGREFTFHGLHPRPPSPVDEGRSTERDLEMMMIANEVAANDVPTIVACDLNDVPWSRTARLFKKVAGLLDPRIGRGFYNSFHTRNPLCRFPLDHVLHTAHFHVVHIERIKQNCGSDHFPILVRLALA